MYHFERLLGTDLLMAQFESFVRDWFVTPSDKPYPCWDWLGLDGEVAFDKLPGVLQTFYALVEKWDFFGYRGSIHLITPSRLSRGAELFPVGPHICFLAGGLGSWFLSTTQDAEGDWHPYFLDRSLADEESVAWRRLPLALDELLVSCALQQIIRLGTMRLTVRPQPGTRHTLAEIQHFNQTDAEQDALERLAQAATPAALLFHSYFDFDRQNLPMIEAPGIPDSKGDPIEIWYHHEAGLLWSNFQETHYQIAMRGQRPSKYNQG